jgi:hypothetical protein
VTLHAGGVVGVPGTRSARVTFTASGDTDIDVFLTPGGTSTVTALTVIGVPSLDEPYDGPPFLDTTAETVSLMVERSVDGGATWEPVWVGESDTAFTDWESLSSGTTWYRATALSATGTGAAAIMTVDADSDALWLSGGASMSRAARLPSNPSVQISAGRARTVQQYDGRPLPVTYAGEAVGRTVAVSGTIFVEADNASVGTVTEVAQLPEPVHMYRDPEGRRIYGALSYVSMGYESAVHWSYSYTLTETER